MNLSFYAGEEKYVTATLSSIDPDEIVVIKEAGFELTDCKGTMVSAGACEIRGQEISVLLPIVFFNLVILCTGNLAPCKCERCRLGRHLKTCYLLRNNLICE